jgi:hypothetical protein
MTGARSRVAVIVVLLGTVCGGPWGCAVKGHLSPPALSDEVRAQLNTVGVSTAQLPPEAGLDAPRSGKAWGALKGAGAGLAAGAVPGLAIASVVSGCHGGGPVALVCGTIIVAGLGVAAAGGTVGAFVGSIYGAVTAESASKIRAAQVELERVLGDLDVQATLRDHVLRTAHERSPMKLVALEEGVDAVLEVQVSTIRFAGQGGINPPLSLIMTAPVRLRRATDGVELYAATFEYRSPGAYKISDWAYADSVAFRETLAEGTRSLAGKVVQLVLGERPDRVSSPAAESTGPAADSADPVERETELPKRIDLDVVAD